MLVLHVVLNIEFGGFSQRLGPMEVASFLASRPIDYPHSIPIGLRIVSHEYFEMRLGNSMPSHDVVEVVLEKH